MALMKKMTVLFAAAACAVLLAGTLCACSQGKTDGDKTGEVSITVSADGWEKATSTPAIAVFTQEGKADATKDAVLICKAIDCNEEVGIGLAPGSYRLQIIGPINKDGSTYTVSSPVEVAVSAGMASSIGTINLTKKASVSADDLTLVISYIKLLEKGDRSADVNALLKLAESNAKAAEGIDDSVIEQAENASKRVVESATTRSASSGSSSGASSAGTTPSGESSSGESGSKGSDTPSHTHSWATRYVVDSPAWVETVHHDAVWEFPPSYQVYVCQCGFETTGQIWDHIDSVHGGNASYSTATRGGGAVLVQDAWDEEISHPETGHNETYCTSCGAVQ